MERSVTVAVLDGNPGTRRGLIRTLEQMPRLSVVGEGGDEDEALRVVGDVRPDVVVADAPRLAVDGVAFLGRLTRAAPGARIVVLTAFVTEQERRDLVQAGARAVLLKEIDSGALARTIEWVAGRNLGDERRAEA